MGFNVRGKSLALVAVATICVWSSSDANAQFGQGYDPSRFVSAEEYKLYAEQLNALLRTRLDEEKAFVNQVVDQVRRNRIPAKLVQSTYGWVRNRRPKTNYPFVYFERVLRLQAKRLGILESVPDFDYDVYRQFRAPVR